MGATLLLIMLPNHLQVGMESAIASPLPPLAVQQGTIRPGTSLAVTLEGLLSPPRLHQLVESARPAYDLSRVAAGHAYGVALDPDGELVAFTYRIDELRTLRVIRRERGLEPELLVRRYSSEVDGVAGSIDSSLFLAIKDAGEHDQLALDMAQIFAWDIDFNTELQTGDSFRIAVEKLYLDGEFKRYGAILAAEFVRGSRIHRAVYFDGGDQPGYYDEEGTPLRKAFLRSPLEFTRISSGFTYRRRHPITKEVRPHLAVDYAAPTGTPVRASADGRVAGAGVMGGLGNAVHLRHANGFETIYGHLSRIRVRRGERVTQGDVIGNVGSTGLATGPHLDYRMKRDGRYVNPLTAQLPPAPPIPSELLSEYGAVRDRALALLPSPAEVRRAAAE
jgi:murein DD-endopeptidase MepM/ murein hydrolase activator NlpD